jgi:hypothetical protein
VSRTPGTESDIQDMLDVLCEINQKLGELLRLTSFVAAASAAELLKTYSPEEAEKMLTRIWEDAP